MKLIVSIIKSELFKRLCIVFFLLFLFITVSAISYANTVSKDLSENLFRLHVIANSDEEKDQNLKYIVRDKVLEYVSKLSKDLNNKEEVINIVGKNMEEIKKVAKDVITKEGYDYDVNIELGIFSFPTKEYGDISLPSGMYDALRIELGEAKRSKLVVCDVSSSLFCGCKFWNCA